MTVVPLRTFTIGGSEVAAAAGVHPYMSAVELYLLKTGQLPDVKNEAMAWGTALEPVIAATLPERGYELMPYPADGATDKARPWATGHPDGLTVIGDEYAVAEIKTMSAYGHREGVVPIHHDAQIQWYLHLTGLPRGLWACLVGGQRLELIEVERNDAAIAVLLALAEDFYGYLVRGEVPAPDGSESARDAVAAMYPHASHERKVRLDKAHMETLHDLRVIRETQARLKVQQTEKENALKVVMEDAELAITPYDTEAVAWRNVTRSALDMARLKRDRPEIYAEYLATTSSRRFTVL